MNYLSLKEILLPTIVQKNTNKTTDPISMTILIKNTLIQSITIEAIHPLTLIKQLLILFYLESQLILLTFIDHPIQKNNLKLSHQLILHYIPQVIIKVITHISISHTKLSEIDTRTQSIFIHSTNIPCEVTQTIINIQMMIKTLMPLIVDYQMIDTEVISTVDKFI